METFMLIISEPFTWGLVVGLFLLVMVWRLMRKDISMLRSEKKRLQEENKELQGHLNTQLKINAKGNDQLEADLIELREQNENLRSNLNVAKQKPGRAELTSPSDDGECGQCDERAGAWFCSRMGKGNA